MNCKPGDLAYVVHTPNGKEVGSVVQIIEAWGTYEPFGHIWTVQFSHPVDTFQRTDERHGRYTGTKTRLQCPDDWLRPISGVTVHDEERDEVTA